MLPELLAKVATNCMRDGKGVFLLGVTGCGKTRRLRLMADTIWLRMRDAADMVRELTQDGSKAAWSTVCNLPEYGVCSPHRYDLIIDDLGVESGDNRVYGNRRDIMAEIIMARYKAFPRFKTHFASNLTEAAIREEYGERIYSRLCEMCVFLTVPGGDRRRQ
jgi:DNA replication protein DnaC